MSRFIILSAPEPSEVSPAHDWVYIQPDDVKAVRHREGFTEILLYGAAEIWIKVAETPAQVVAFVEPKHVVGATPSTAFFGRN